MTKKELEDGEFRWIEQLALPLKKHDTLKEGEDETEKIYNIWGFLDMVYEKLVSLIIGSFYVSLYEKNIATSFSQDIAGTRKNIGPLDFAK